MGYVYLLSEWSKNDQHYKIGVTKGSVEARIKNLQTGNSNEIVLVQKYQTPNFNKVERWLHRVFRECRLEGEWFDLTDEQVRSFLTEAKKADNTINLLLNENPFYR